MPDLPAHPVTGKNIVVTGAGGISSALVQECVRHGARVHVIAVDEKQVQELGSLGSGVTFSVADLRSDSDTLSAFDEAEALLSHIDGLVAVAGGSGRNFGDGPIDTLSTEALLKTTELNLVTAGNSLREAIVRHLRHKGHGARLNAVLIGSVLAHFPAGALFGTHAYAATKAALEGLARSTAGYYANHGVSVNVIAPGLARTPMAARAQADAKISEYARRRQPLSSDGFIDPAEIASACLWLLGSQSVTGQIIAVDGGWSVFGGETTDSE